MQFLFSFVFEFFRAFRNKLNLLLLCDATAEKHEISYSIYNPIKLKFAQKWNNFDQFYSLMHPSHCLPCPPINFGNLSFDTGIGRVFIGFMNILEYLKHRFFNELKTVTPKKVWNSQNTLKQLQVYDNKQIKENR